MSSYSGGLHGGPFSRRIRGSGDAQVPATAVGANVPSIVPTPTAQLIGADEYVNLIIRNDTLHPIPAKISAHQPKSALTQAGEKRGDFDYTLAVARFQIPNTMVVYQNLEAAKHIVYVYDVEQEDPVAEVALPDEKVYGVDRLFTVVNRALYEALTTAVKHHVDPADPDLKSNLLYGWQWDGTLTAYTDDSGATKHYIEKPKGPGAGAIIKSDHTNEEITKANYYNKFPPLVSVCNSLVNKKTGLRGQLVFFNNLFFNSYSFIQPANSSSFAEPHLVPEDLREEIQKGSISINTLRNRKVVGMEIEITWMPPGDLQTGYMAAWGAVAPKNSDGSGNALWYEPAFPSSDYNYADTKQKWIITVWIPQMKHADEEDHPDVGHPDAYADLDGEDTRTTTVKSGFTGVQVFNGYIDPQEFKGGGAKKMKFADWGVPQSEMVSKELYDRVAGRVTYSRGRAMLREKYHTLTDGTTYQPHQAFGPALKNADFVHPDKESFNSGACFVTIESDSCILDDNSYRTQAGYTKPTNKDLSSGHIWVRPSLVLQPEHGPTAVGNFADGSANYHAAGRNGMPVAAQSQQADITQYMFSRDGTDTNKFILECAQGWGESGKYHVALSPDLHEVLDFPLDATMGHVPKGLVLQTPTTLSTHQDVVRAYRPVSTGYYNNTDFTDDYAGTHMKDMGAPVIEPPGTDSDHAAFGEFKPQDNAIWAQEHGTLNLSFDTRYLKLRSPSLPITQETSVSNTDAADTSRDTIITDFIIDNMTAATTGNWTYEPQGTLREYALNTQMWNGAWDLEIWAEAKDGSEELLEIEPGEVASVKVRIRRNKTY